MTGQALPIFVNHCNFFRAIAINLRIISYLCAIILIATLMSTQMMNQKIADYFKTQPIERAWLFGSFARGEETPISDVDILVQFDEDGVSLCLKRHYARE